MEPPPGTARANPAVVPRLLEGRCGIALVGAGRMGTALAGAMRAAGLAVEGPSRRGEVPRSRGAPEAALGAVLLCVHDEEIEAAADSVRGLAPFVGHTSGATPLAALEPSLRSGADGFGFHPLQTLTGLEDDPAGRLAGAGCAIAGSSPPAVALARGLAERLEMSPFEIADDRRSAYHAAASTASNFLVTLQDAAERIAGGAGLSPAEARGVLAPLVRATVENWAAAGPEQALTGPVARGDEATVAAQRAAIQECEPALLPLFGELVECTRALALRRAADSDVRLAAGRSS